MIALDRIRQHTLSTQPFHWAFVDKLFAPGDAAVLARSYPRDRFKTVRGNDAEKSFEYEARALVHMGAELPSHPESLSLAWRRLANDLVSPAYRAAMSDLTGIELARLPIEVNVFHYGPGDWLGPHLDLEDKIVTHVLYFNEAWNEADGGCLNILRSKNISDVAAVVVPIVGNSAVLVRSERSWHAVSRVVEGCRLSRRSMTVTFYRPGSNSTMWPPGDTTPLHQYE